MSEQPIRYVGHESVRRLEVRHEGPPKYTACPEAVLEPYPGHGRHEHEVDGQTVKCRGYRLEMGAVFQPPPLDPRYSSAEQFDNEVAGKHYPGNRAADDRL